MGRQDEPELSDDQALAADEAATRALLARFGEPVAIAPPPTLAARVVVGLPRTPPPPEAHPWRRAAAWLGAAAMALSLALGAWGVLLNSLGPARVAGGPADGLGQFVLILTLAAKPLVNLLAESGLLVILAPLTILAAGWLWWRLVRTTPLTTSPEVS